MGDAADDLFDSYADAHDDEFDEGIECNRCCATGLHWGETDDRWSLHEENGDRHDCRLTEAAEGFERIE
jgi:hypothetical protein